jgi:hypothetical protein
MRAWPVAIALMLAAIGGYLALFPLLRSLEPGSSFARDAATLVPATVSVNRASPTVVAAAVHPGARFVRALPARRAGTTGGGTAASPAVTTGQATTFVNTSGAGRRATRPATTATPSRTRTPVTGAGEQGSGAGLASSQSSSGAQVTGGSQVTLGPSR